MTVPFDRVIWTAEECAEYLRQESSTFLKRTQHIEGFPARLSIPGQPRWQAKAVTDWALSKQDPHPESRQDHANAA